MNMRLKKYNVKIWAQLSLIVVTIADMSLSTCCLWLLNQPILPEQLKNNRL
ncbi:MAG: hypothetical protein CVU84_14595 [Firmicutes bacterium HGW-Firmicutes-1]|jgi:cyclic lactone autoinducer peptide|nr:MAG: hypothetical protein CVU84_14595 [Firmicutes bacterium HGW-Firmicutes-1]